MGMANSPIGPTPDWACRYLARLDQEFDDWEADCFRRGCSFLARGMARGAASNWNAMLLPASRRNEVSQGPFSAQPMTRSEEDRLRGLLNAIIGGHRTAFPEG